MCSAKSTEQSSQLIQAYLDHLLLVRRYSPHTVSAVRQDLNLITGDPAQASQQHLKSLLVQRHASGLAPSSLARMLSSWRGFFAHLHEAGTLASNPALGLRAPKLPKRLPKALSVDHLNGLLSGPLPKAPFSHAIAHLLIELLYATGLRISEAIALELPQPTTSNQRSWINVDRAELQVLGKGGKTRIVPLTRILVDLIHQWLSIRACVLQDHGVSLAEFPYLLVSAKGRAYGVRQAQKDLAAYAKHRQLPVHLHPHMLRHSFGSHVLQESQNLRAVQELLGHSSIASTQVYTSLDFKHLAKVYDESFPRSKRK